MTTDTYNMLKACVDSGGLLLHGSTRKIDLLRGKPLYATDRVFLAILIAILPRTRTFNAVRYRGDGHIHAPASIIRLLQPGYVHVVPRGRFRKAEGDKPTDSSAQLGGEFVTCESIEPFEIVKVSADDLPTPIEERPNSEFNRLKSSYLQMTTHKRGFRQRVKNECPYERR